MVVCLGLLSFAFTFHYEYRVGRTMCRRDVDFFFSAEYFFVNRNCEKTAQSEAKLMRTLLDVPVSIASLTSASFSWYF
jgi:hypothetical protein